LTVIQNFDAKHAQSINRLISLRHIYVIGEPEFIVSRPRIYINPWSRRRRT